MFGSFGLMLCPRRQHRVPMPSQIHRGDGLRFQIGMKEMHVGWQRVIGAVVSMNPRHRGMPERHHAGQAQQHLPTRMHSAAAPRLHR